MRVYVYRAALMPVVLLLLLLLLKNAGKAERENFT